MRPAHQSLEAEDASVDLRLRLEVKGQFAVAQGMAKVGLQHPAVANDLVGFGFVDTDLPARLGLDVIKGCARIGEQKRPAVAVERIGGDSDADTDADGFVVDHDV